MATITIFIPKDNGDLKYVADVEEEDDAAMALDAVLDEMPRLKDTTFVALVSEEGNGVGHTCVLEIGEEPPSRRPKRNIAVSNGVAPLAGNSDDESEEEAVEPEEEVATKQTRTRRGATTQKRAAKKPPARKPAAKKAPAASGGRKLAKKPPARKKASGRKAPYTRSAKSDD